MALILCFPSLDFALQSCALSYTLLAVLTCKSWSRECFLCLTNNWVAKEYYQSGPYVLATTCHNCV